MKYELTSETKYGLTRIRALKDFGTVKAGDLGGWIEKEYNLSQEGNAWVSGNACVYGNAWVYGNALITKVNLTAVRSDNYTFSVVSTPEGVRVIAGCRYFSFEEARQHWTKTRANTPLGEETFAILDLLEAQARIHRM